jgi:hypothetical protein
MAILKFLFFVVHGKAGSPVQLEARVMVQDAKCNTAQNEMAIASQVVRPITSRCRIGQDWNRHTRMSITFVNSWILLSVVLAMT